MCCGLVVSFAFLQFDILLPVADALSTTLTLTASALAGARPIGHLIRLKAQAALALEHPLGAGHRVGEGDALRQQLQGLAGVFRRI